MQWSAARCLAWLACQLQCLTAHILRALLPSCKVHLQRPDLCLALLLVCSSFSYSAVPFCALFLYCARPSDDFVHVSGNPKAPLFAPFAPFAPGRRDRSTMVTRMRPKVWLQSPHSSSEPVSAAAHRAANCDPGLEVVRPNVPPQRNCKCVRSRLCDHASPHSCWPCAVHISETGKPAEAKAWRLRR